MANIKTIRRYALIIEKLKTPFYTSMVELKAFLERHDLYPSERTLQRDFNALRNSFGLEIVYDRDKGGYRYEATNDIDSARLLSLIEQVNTIDLYNSPVENQVSFIDFQRPPSHSGSVYLKQLVKAIADSVKVKIDYQPYRRKEKREFTVQPYLVKQYNLRWYVYGYIEEYNDRRTLALDDRMQSLVLTKERFKKEPIDTDALFTNVVGLSLEHDEPMDLKLKVSSMAANYLKSRPIHHSQRVLSENEDYTVFMFHVVNNTELRQEIFKLGGDAEVLEPIGFRDEIAANLAEWSALYKS
jgi:predicted DNA-binding transcriptional regulator YafY